MDISIAHSTRTRAQLHHKRSQSRKDNGPHGGCETNSNMVSSGYGYSYGSSSSSGCL